MKNNKHHLDNIEQKFGQVINCEGDQTSDQILHQNFTKYGGNAKEWMRKCVLLLPEIEKRRIWEKKGFSCIYEYAAKLAGMSHSTVDDALRILKKVEDKPELRKVIELRGINAVRPVASIATKETEKFWAKKAKKMSKNTLELYVREFRGLSCTSTELKKEISMDLDPDVADKLEKLKGEEDWNTLMKEFLKMKEEKMEENRPEKVKAKSRYIPAEIKRYALGKTRGGCAFPGCHKPSQILHHTQRFALQKEHIPDKIIPLCKGHERLVHLGLIENEDSSPEYWQVRHDSDKNDLKFLIDQRVQEFRNI